MSGKLKYFKIGSDWWVVRFVELFINFNCLLLNVLFGWLIGILVGLK